MNAIERARLKNGQKIKWQDRFFVYRGFSHKAHILLEDGREEKVIYPTGFQEMVPFYEYLSNEKILTADILRK